MAGLLFHEYLPTILSDQPVCLCLPMASSSTPNEATCREAYRRCNFSATLCSPATFFSSCLVPLATIPAWNSFVTFTSISRWTNQSVSRASDRSIDQTSSQADSESDVSKFRISAHLTWAYAAFGILLKVCNSIHSVEPLVQGLTTSITVAICSVLSTFRSI